MRQALNWTFPRPSSTGLWVWAGVTVLYALLVVVGVTYEMLWLLDFDPENGAPIPLIGVTITFPTGLLGLAIAAPLANALGLGDDGSTVLIWSGMCLGGLFQAWWVWRLGTVLARRAQQNSHLIGSVLPPESPSFPGGI